MASAAIPARYVGQRFVASTADQKAVRVQVKAFRDFIVEQPRWAALVLAGECGTGKTLLACEFVESMVKNLGMSARYLTAKGMISEIQATYGREGRSEETEIARLASYDVLVIDEIDAKPDTANANLLLNEIVNRRYSDGKPVVVITNQKFSDLGQYVGDRVYSRLHENSFVCAHTWADARRAA
ncbi:ATP-binding protein [Oxalobacteraceae bacterium]|nr:ATP-binding protein [Oxalobacteraceae bacterium]